MPTEWKQIRRKCRARFILHRWETSGTYKIDDVGQEHHRGRHNRRARVRIGRNLAIEVCIALELIIAVKLSHKHKKKKMNKKKGLRRRSVGRLGWGREYNRGAHRRQGFPSVVARRPACHRGPRPCVWIGQRWPGREPMAAHRSPRSLRQRYGGGERRRQQHRRAPSPRTGPRSGLLT